VALALEEDGNGNIIHIVGKDYGRKPPVYAIETFEISSKTSSVFQTQWPCDALLPTPSAVWVGKVGYIFIGNGNCTGGFLKWLGEGQPLEFIKLQNIPSSAEYGWDGVGGVWVEKLNRIYLFGGYVFPKYLDGIWFMEIQNDDGQEKIEL
jgi:hypothetical protein